MNPSSVSRTRRGRRIALVAAGLFLLSWIFPLSAALPGAVTRLPKWWGPLDVVIAILVGILAIVTSGTAGRTVTPEIEAATYRAYRVLIQAILAILVVFLLFGDRIVWTHMLVGFAWRYWLLLYTLPAWLAALRGKVADQ